MLRFRSALAALAVSTIAASAAAQEAAPAGQPAPAPAQSSSPKNTITVNPLGLAFGMLNFEYERATSDSMSFFVGPSYWSFGTTGLDDASVSSYGLNGGVRLFLTGTAPEGFFVSPTLGLAYATTEYGDGGASSFGYSAGAIGGYTWLFGGVFDLSLGLGVQYAMAEATAKLGDDEVTVGYSGVLPAARLSLGAAF